MKSKWKTYLLYASLIIVGGGLVFILVETVRANNTGFETKTLWDWMELLIIPLVLAIGAFFLQRSERAVEREIAQDRQQETALQAYIDKMTELLLDKGMENTKNNEVLLVAKTRTLTILRVLDGKRKIVVLQFLRDARLVGPYRLEEKSFFDLVGADLQFADLRGANLENLDLREANLQHADLRGAKIYETNFSKADMRYANLQNTGVVKSWLMDTDLSYTNMSNAKFWDTNTTNAIFKFANLKGAEFHPLQHLDIVKSLKGATMPDGTKHE